MEFGDNLKKFRKNNKMTQEDLADKVGVTRQSVSKWETGEAYPEMSNIVCLCKIFHCEITDLINDNIVDTEKFDDSTKKELILFKKNQQKRMKYISRAIYIISRIVNIIISIPAVFLILMSVLFPIFSSSFDINDERLSMFGKEVEIKVSDNNLYVGDKQINIDTKTNLEEFLNSHSRTFYIICIEYVLISLAVLSTLISHFLYLIYKLYKNISVDSTPFNLQNEKIVNKAIIIYIVYFVLMKLTALIFMAFSKINLMIDFNIKDFISILIIISVVYLFKYGRMIQLDSKTKIYD